MKWTLHKLDKPKQRFRSIWYITESNIKTFNKNLNRWNHTLTSIWSPTTALFLMLSFLKTASRRRWKVTCFRKRSFSLAIRVAPCKSNTLLNTGKNAFQKDNGWFLDRKLMNTAVMQSSFPTSVAMLCDAAIIENFLVTSKTWRLTEALKFSSHSSYNIQEPKPNRSWHKC